MLTVSLVGKKFSCSIQLQISAEKEGGGLELALKAGEKCNNCPQSVSNVNATLNITIQKDCSNYVTKCKEMLMFLQEQALPKTMNIMKVHMVNREMKNIQKDDTRLFSCIKQKKRERERCRDRSVSTDRLTTRGYSSDSDQAIRHPCAGSEHLSRMDILATPRMSRHKLKNAALLRNRKDREASKERSSVPEKESKAKNQTIQLKLKDPRKNRTVKKVETEFEKEGSLIYEGSSESSLCDLANKSSSLKSIEMKDSEESEPLDLKDYKATESDMSVDSLECLDIEPSKYEARKKKKKKPPRSEETRSQADKKSKPSKASIVPPLVFPSDLYDWSSSDLSDTKCNAEQQNELSGNTKSETSNLNLEALSQNELLRVMKESSQEIVQNIMSSAIKKCERGIPTGTLLGPYSGKITGGFSCESLNNDSLYSKDENIEEVCSEKTTINLTDISHAKSTSFSAISKREVISMASGTEHIAQEPGTVKNAQCSNEVKQGPTCTPRSTQTSPVESNFNKDIVSSKEHLDRTTEQHAMGEKDINSRKHNDFPVKLYDSHDNITKQIIHSMSRALNMKSKLVTPSGSHVLVSPSRSQALVSSDVAASRSHVMVTHDSCTHASEQYSIHKDLMSRNPARLEKPIAFQIELPSSLQQYSAQDGKEISLGSQKDLLGNDVLSSSANVDDQDTLIEEFCKKLPYSSKEISSKINSSSDQIPTSGYCFFVIGPDENVEQKQNKINPESADKKDGAMHAVESVQRRRKTSLYRRSLSHQNERKKWQTTTDMIAKVHHRSLSVEGKSKAARASKCASCPVLSEEDIVLEGLESHHQDVCNSLSQRTWISLRVHELWKANKHEEALNTCMELTGVKKAEKSDAESLSGSSTALDLIGNKDIVLFLNILQQLPIAGAAWTLDMCDLILPELKLFMSTRIHTSHVEMTCNILQVIVKKVSGAVLKAQAANKAEKSFMIRKCVNHLQDVRERASKVLMARRPKMYCTVTTEDPIALKPVLRELLTVIQTLLSVYTD